MFPRLEIETTFVFGLGLSTSPTSLSRPGSRSAGPSPLTVHMPAGSGNAVDTIPLAVAFQEVVHALFRGSDENRYCKRKLKGSVAKKVILIVFIFVSIVSRCQVRIGGDMMLSFPAGLIQLMNSQPNGSIPPISFRIRNFQSLENVVPNKQVLNM